MISTRITYIAIIIITNCITAILTSQFSSIGCYLWKINLIIACLLMISPVFYILFKIFAHRDLKKHPTLRHIAEEHVKTQYRIIGYVLYKLSCGSHTTPREIGFELFGMGSIENIIKTAPILQFIDWIKDDGQTLTTDSKLILKEEIYKDKELLSKVIDEIDFWNRDAFGRYAGLPDSYCVID